MHGCRDCLLPTLWVLCIREIKTGRARLRCLFSYMRFRFTPKILLFAPNQIQAMHYWTCQKGVVWWKKEEWKVEEKGGGGEERKRVKYSLRVRKRGRGARLNIRLAELRRKKMDLATGLLWLRDCPLRMKKVFYITGLMRRVLPCTFSSPLSLSRSSTLSTKPNPALSGELLPCTLWTLSGQCWKNT